MAKDTINFNRDIRPILSDKCFLCHGPDEEDREEDLRLDIPDGEQGALTARMITLSSNPVNLRKVSCSCELRKNGKKTGCLLLSHTRNH